MHFVFACADAPSDADAATALADRAVPYEASKWLENAFPPVISKSVRHRVDRVFACGVPRRESSWHPQLGSQFPVLPADSETTASVRWLRCPPAPGAVVGNKIPALRCLRASAFDSRLLRLRCRASPGF